jgi:hypothetical protein
VDCHGSHEPAGLENGHADHGADGCENVGFAVLGIDSLVIRTVEHDVCGAGAHESETLGAELTETIPTDDALSSVRIVPGEDEGVLVGLDKRVRAAMHAKMLPQYASGRVRDVFRSYQRSHGIV